MAYELKEYLKAINESKEDLMKSDETWIKKYPAYIINRCLSMFWDTLPQANEMNGYHFLSNQVQFQFLINSVRKKKTIWWSLVKAIQIVFFRVCERVLRLQ
jgi:hypothetical protein